MNRALSYAAFGLLAFAAIAGFSSAFGSWSPFGQGGPGFHGGGLSGQFNKSGQAPFGQPGGRGPFGGLNESRGMHFSKPNASAVIPYDSAVGACQVDRLVSVLDAEVTASPSLGANLSSIISSLTSDKERLSSFETGPNETAYREFVRSTLESDLRNASFQSMVSMRYLEGVDNATRTAFYEALRSALAAEYSCTASAIQQYLPLGGGLAGGVGARPFGPGFGEGARVVPGGFGRQPQGMGRGRMNVQHSRRGRFA